MDDISTFDRDADVTHGGTERTRRGAASDSKWLSGNRRMNISANHIVEEGASEPNAYLTRSVHVVGRTVESLAD
jgi:hypothetical protein